ncbi:Dynein intermediate chain 1, axonemal [Penaeus vannamei]|uniref:Dynein intermediate chain 1, axonemal n=1 Tax=Penaeus vannamei TaxID=6689 RepID=A0A3R7PP84_PENVA|nr:Dynein intermediate chain 1, axonemal [Penaeus vannamei]
MTYGVPMRSYSNFFYSISFFSPSSFFFPSISSCGISPSLLPFPFLHLPLPYLSRLPTSLSPFHLSSYLSLPFLSFPIFFPSPSLSIFASLLPFISLYFLPPSLFLSAPSIVPFFPLSSLTVLPVFSRDFSLFLLPLTSILFIFFPLLFLLLSSPPLFFFSFLLPLFLPLLSSSFLSSPFFLSPPPFPSSPPPSRPEVKDPVTILSTALPKTRHPEPLDLPGLPRVAKFWEDASDEYHPLEGSLLPLWKFKYEHSKSLLVSDICWSPVYADLFAISYVSSGVDGGGEEMGGMLCLYTLKSPSTPERVFHTPFGVVTARFHPQHGSMLVAGRTDGSVVVYDVKAPRHAPPICSSPVRGKHLMQVTQVTQVRWIRTQPGEELCFFSVSLDGRVTQWHLHSAGLVHRDVLDFASCRQPTKLHSSSDKERPPASTSAPTQNIMLLGTDTGAVFQCSVASTTHTLFRYPAHTSPVRQVSWNKHHHGIFVTCSLDWTVKVWQHDFVSPLIQLDLGGAVAGVTWTPHSSSVFVAVTDEGRVHVYDLHVRICHPLCVQGVVQKKRGVVTCIAFSPFHPVILVGGDRGRLVSFKLSPNLRRQPKDAKGCDAQQLREIEVCKIERIIATTRG